MPPRELDHAEPSSVTTTAHEECPMTPDQIVRAWKDAHYCSDLATNHAALPPNPVGPIDLTDEAIDLAAGGDIAGTEYLESLGCCNGITERTHCDITAGYICTTTCFTIFFTADSICG